jgi:hypothetical protein
MHRLGTLNLPPHRGRDFFLAVFVEPETAPVDSPGWNM